MNLQEMLELAGDEIRAAMDELKKRGITVCSVDVMIEPTITSSSGAAECVRSISARMTPNARTHRLPPGTGAASECSVRSIPRIETAMRGGSSVQ